MQSANVNVADLLKETPEQVDRKRVECANKGIEALEKLRRTILDRNCNQDGDLTMLENINATAKTIVDAYNKSKLRK